MEKNGKQMMINGGFENAIKIVFCNYLLINFNVLSNFSTKNSSKILKLIFFKIF